MIDEDDEHSNRDTLEYHFIAHRQQTINACAQAQVENLLGVLDERERRIIVRRFGLYGEPESTRQELAHEEHLTSERIRQIEQQALQKMRNAAQSA
jgi:RNA polymerase primary sigma factor